LVAELSTSDASPELLTMPSDSNEGRRNPNLGVPERLSHFLFGLSEAKTEVCDLLSAERPRLAKRTISPVAIVDAISRLRSHSCIIDGEAVACDDNALLSFDLVRHQRANERTPASKPNSLERIVRAESGEMCELLHTSPVVQKMHGAQGVQKI